MHSRQFVDHGLSVGFGPATGKRIERISFLDTLRWLAAARDDEILITLVVNPHRPYRYEPRVRKRWPKQYPLMQTPRLELRKSWVNNVDTD